MPNDISDIDKQLIQIQRSTRTLLPIFAVPHDLLRRHLRFYYNWHLKPYSHFAHWLTLGVYTIGVFLFCLNQLGYFDYNHGTRAAAGIPKMISYQGKLTDHNNVPVADGNYNLKISIYDADTAGNRIWTWNGTTVAPDAVAVSVVNGIFSVMLGDTVTYSGTNTLTLDFNADSYWLGVTVGSDAEMVPRKRLGAVGYAYNSDTVDGKHAAAFALLAGLSGGQTIDGGTAASENLTLSSTADATKGKILLGASSAYDEANVRLGIGTATPSYALSFGAGSAKVIGLERSASTSGDNLTLSSGGALSGGTNLAGGDLVLSSGISTGTGTSKIQFSTAAAGTTGASDNTPSVKMTILGNGNVGIGTLTPGAAYTASKLDLAASTTTDIGVRCYGCTPGFTGASLNGTEASPSATTYGQTLLYLSGAGYADSAYTTKKIGITFSAAETWTASAQGTYMDFSTTGLTSTTRSVRLRIGESGNFYFGTPNFVGAMSNFITLNGTAARTLGMERNTTSAVGQAFTVSAGGAPIHGSIITVSATPTAGGSGYSAGDILTIASGTGGTVHVSAVDGSGAVTSVTLASAGSGYLAGTGQATTGGTGTSCTLNITAVASSTDLAGGALILSSGTSTGTGASSIQFYTATAGSTGTADNTPTLKMTLDGAGALTVGTIYGSASSGGTLTLGSTSHATKGKILLGAISAFDEVNTRLGIGTATPTNALSFGVGTNRTIAVERSVTTTGSAIAITAGGAVSGGTDLNGGDVIITSGISTGTGSSKISFRTYGSAGSTGTSDNSVVTAGIATAYGSLARWGFGMSTGLPSYLISLSGQAARTIGMERHTTADTAGNGLTILAGGATALATDKSGGNLVLSSGTSTGTGSSIIQFSTPTPAGSTGTGDNAPSVKMTINGSGYVGIGAAPGSLLDIAGSATDELILRAADSAGSMKLHMRDSVRGYDGYLFVDTSNRIVLQNDSGNQIAITGGGVPNMGVARHTTGGGLAWTISSQGALSGGTDLNGGDLVLASGIATGSGSSKIQFSTVTAGASGTDDRAATVKMTILGNGNVGIGTATPSTALSLSGLSAQTIGMERYTASNHVGYGLTIQAGGAGTGATDKAGGDLILSSGISTGTANSTIQFNTAPASTSGTSDNTPALRVVVSDGIASIATLAEGQIVATNLMRSAKATLIEDIYGMLTSPTNIKGMWFMDQAGATTAITDRGTLAHDITLSANASTLTPKVMGLAPNLLFSASATFSAGDQADFTFGNGTTDSAFSIVSFVNMTDATSGTFLAKQDATTASKQQEWRFITGADDTLQAMFIDNSSSGYIGRIDSSAVTSDQGSWHVYAMTYSGSGTNAGINIYRDGVDVDNADSSSGSYTAMEDKTAVVGSYTINSSGSQTGFLKGALGFNMLVGEELTPAQVARITRLLQGYGNVPF